MAPRTAETLLPPVYDGQVTFTRKEVAAILGISLNTLLSNISSGRIHENRYSPRCLRITRAEVMRVLTEGIGND